jgi:hypothetical protein
MKTISRFGLMLTLLCTCLISQRTLAQDKTSSDAHTVSNEALKEYVGEYNIDGGQGFNITITLDGDDKLMAQPSNKSQPNTLLKATAADKFDLVNTGGLKIAFNREDDKIVSLTFSQGTQAFTAKRVKKE